MPREIKCSSSIKYQSQSRPFAFQLQTRFLEYIFFYMRDKQEKAPSFLVKLLNILRSKEYSKIINWDAQQSGIKIFNTRRLEEEILPRYYRHKNLRSFVRQLNMYGFHKVYLDDERSIFHHNIFNPRNKESINQIRRKVPQEGENKETHIGSSSMENKKPNKIFYEENQLRAVENSKKQDNPVNSKKSSFKLLFRNSLRNFSDQKKKQVKENSAEQVLDQVIAQIAPLKLSEQLIKVKIEELREQPKFRKFLKRGSFLSKIYSKLGIQINQDEDILSELSIENQLMYTNTKKEVSLASLKMFESRPMYLRDTIGMFLN